MENKNNGTPGNVTYKDLYTAIFTRASPRKFDPTPLPTQTLERIVAFISNIQPLLSDNDITHRIVDAEAVKGLALPKAPHFLLISGRHQPMRDICAGFLYQHAVLYLHSIGLGARWLSSAKGKDSDPDHIVGIAFGTPAQPATRRSQDFIRKSVEEIASGTDPRLEAVRLAPSGMNGQPWYFIVDKGCIHVYYREKLRGLLGRLYHQTGVDLGIGLCHLAIASLHEGKPFSFAPHSKTPPAPPKGYVYVGSVEDKNKPECDRC